MFRYSHTLLVSFLFFSVSSLAYGQDAQIQGQVLDPSGAAIPKAIVRVVDQRTGTEAKTETNENGEYTVPALNPGSVYKVFVQAAGFSTAASDPITLIAAQSALLNFTLRLGGISANVDVTAVVTAEKRSELLLDTPVPVSVINAETLSENDLVHLRDYSTYIPGLTVIPVFESKQLLAVRGITTSAGNPTVGMTIDDVPYGSSTQWAGNTVPDIDPSDLAHVEVLRGSQGTLYGANSMGGLFKYVTVDPSTSGYSGRLEVGSNGIYNGAESGYSVRGSVNIPVADTLAVRASAYTRQDAGYIDDPVRKIDGINKTETYGGRLSTLLRLGNSSSLKLAALYQHSDPTGLSDVTVLPSFGAWQQHFVPGAHQGAKTSQSYSAVLTVGLGNANLTALGGYNVNRTFDGLDRSDALSATALRLYGVPGAVLYSDALAKKFSQEIRLSGHFGKSFDWLVGGYYTYESARLIQRLRAEDPTSGQDYLIRDTYYPTTYEEYAAFEDFTYHFTDKLDIQVGGRETHINQTYEQTSTGVVPLPSLPTEHASFNSFTYLATPKFKISPDAMIYARFASGYRPGGINAVAGTPLPASYGPDKTNDYEVGFKGDLLSRKITIDASLYYIDWKQIQLSLLQVIPNLGAFGYNTNAGGARSQGAELSVTVKPRPATTISTWATYDDAALTQPFPVGSTVYGFAGNKLPFTSPWSGNASLRQTFPLWGEVTGYAEGMVSSVSHHLGLFQGTPVRQYYPGYSKVDLRVGVNYQSWSANIYVNNLANKRILLDGGVDYFPTYSYFYMQPRTIGVSLSKTFSWAGQRRN